VGLPIVAVVNKSSLVQQADLEKAVDAIQKQVSMEFAEAWKIDATLASLAATDALPAGAWPIYLEDVCTLPGALGYHEDEAIPSGRVGVQTCEDDGVAWSSCLSHEVLELLVDPYARLAGETSLGWYAFEVCDPVEGTTVYARDGVQLENFCKPNWWVEGSPGPWDYLCSLKAPLTLLAGGYATVQAPGSVNWVQINAEHVRPSKRRAAAHSRRARRAARSAR
jgi:hypothetical protein